MTYSPFSSKLEDNQQFIDQYYEDNKPDIYEEPEVVEGRPGPDGKTASAEDKPKDDKNLLDRAIEFATEKKDIVAPIASTAAKTIPVVGRHVAGAINAAAADTDAEREGEILKSSALELGMIDFGMDVIGNIPGAASIDDSWDEMTKFKNPNTRLVRDVASVIVPSVAVGVATGGLGAKAAAAINGGKLASGLTTAGTSALGDVAVTYFSDYSERDEGMARGLDDALEGIGRPMGLKIPDGIKILDGDSPEVRQRKLLFEAAGMSIVGDALSYLFTAGKPVLNWFEPKDKTAEVFKLEKVTENPDPDTIFRSMELDEEINQLTDEILDAAPGVDVEELISRRDLLQEQNAQLLTTYSETGRTSATIDPFASHVRQNQSIRDLQTDQLGAKALSEDPNLSQYNPNVQSLIGEESSRPRQFVPAANVARNALDIAASESGTSKGLPAPLLTEPMLRDGLELDEHSRKTVSELVEDLNEGGRFSGVLDGFRYSSEQMHNNALNLFAKIVSAKDLDELKSALMPRKYIKQFDDTFGVEQIQEAAVQDVGKAIKYLSKEFLGEDVAAMSARAIETTAKEIDVHLDAMNVFKGQVDEDAVQDIIIQKLGFLSEEYGIAKYTAGWSLRNFQWWKQAENSAVVAEQFADFAKKNRESAQAFTKNLTDLKQKNPELASTLMMAYDATKGEVDSIASLNAYVRHHLNPLTMVRSNGKFGESEFSKGMWGVLYNNVLSGLSAGRAMIGAVSDLGIKPTGYLVGAGIRGVLKSDFTDLRKGFYAFGIEHETIGRALKEGFDTFKRASQNPEIYMDAMRADYKSVQKGKMNMEILDRMEQKALADGNYGQVAMHRFVKVNQQLALNKYMRYGTNAMLGIDAMTNYMVGTMTSKLRSFDEVYQAGQKMNPEQLIDAQQKHFHKVFDKNTGLIKDSWTRSQAQEIALNERTGFGDSIGKVLSKYPALRYAMMFPNTGINFVRKAASYTPFAAIPGTNKYAKTLYASTEAQIDEALALHGISRTDPDKLKIIENLKTEYTGRIAIGSMMAVGLAHYGLAGNIRGNLPRDKARRNAMLSVPGYRPKTIKIAGNWVSYDGIVPLDPILTIIGDLSYYSTDISEPFKEDIMQKLVWTLTQSISGATPLQGIEPLVAMMQGDDSGMQRFLTNTARMAIPQSGAQGVLAKAVTNANKETYNDLSNYISSRIPFVNLTVPDKIDWWTGQPINEIDNHLLRILNAVNPIPVSGGEEGWRRWVNESGLDLSQNLLKDSTGTHTYSAEERSILSKFIGEQQLWKKIEGNGKTTGYMNNKKYNDQLDIVRAELATGKTFDELQPQTRDLDIVKRLREDVLEAKKAAEAKMFRQYPALAEKIRGSQLVENYMRQGRPSKAFDTAEKFNEKVQKLQQFR